MRSRIKGKNKSKKVNVRKSRVNAWKRGKSPKRKRRTGKNGGGLISTGVSKGILPFLLFSGSRYYRNKSKSNNRKSMKGLKRKKNNKSWKKWRKTSKKRSYKR